MLRNASTHPVCRRDWTLSQEDCYTRDSKCCQNAWLTKSARQFIWSSTTLMPFEKKKKVRNAPKSTPISSLASRTMTLYTVSSNCCRTRFYLLQCVLICLLTFHTLSKDIVFRFIIEYSSSRDFGP